jgi:hypothetical protein
LGKRTEAQKGGEFSVSAKNTETGQKKEKQEEKEGERTHGNAFVVYDISRQVFPTAWAGHETGEVKKTRKKERKGVRKETGGDTVFPPRRPSRRA